MNNTKAIYHYSIDFYISGNVVQRYSGFVEVKRAIQNMDEANRLTESIIKTAKERAGAGRAGALLSSLNLVGWAA